MDEKETNSRLPASEQEEERLQGLRALARAGGEVLLPALLRALGDESWRVRKEAVETFLSLAGAGSLGAEVVELLHAEENAGLRNAAVEILVRLGRQAVPALLAELSCPDHDVRKFVLDILGEIGDAASLPALIGALADADGNVRVAAAENLGKLGLPEAVPHLLQAMEQADLWLRFTILEALARIGESVPLPRLLPCRDEKLLRKPLCDCLGRVGGPEVVGHLVEGLLDPARNVREAAAVALEQVVARWGETAAGELAARADSAAAAAVAELLDSHDPGVRRAALRLFARIGDSRLAPRLLPLLQVAEVREEAVAVLIAMGRPAACSLLGRWQQSDPLTRVCLAHIVGEAQCHEGIDLLLSGLEAPEPELRSVSARALGRIGGPTAIAPLAGCLEDADEEVREAAVQALGRLGLSHRQQVLLSLSPLLRHEDPGLRRCAVQILGPLAGPETGSALTLALKDESPLVRRAAVRAVEARGDRSSLAALTLALTDEDVEVRRLAAEALGAGGNRETAGPLELALQDEDPWVRAAAVRSLARLAGRAAAPLLATALADQTGLVAIAALETLAAVDSDQAFGALTAALGHQDEEVVNAALKLLAASGRRDWLPAAVEPLLNHAHWEVRLVFARTLAELEGQGSRLRLEERLLVEGEDLVRQQLLELLVQLEDGQG